MEGDGLFDVMALCLDEVGAQVERRLVGVDEDSKALYAEDACTLLFR